ncbi:MAG: hypothetical protein ACJ8F7_08840 [Gemmataceae bacterium]
MNVTRAPRTFLSGDTLKIWTNPGATPNIVVLVRGTLYVSAIAKADLNKAAQRLSTGAAPEQVFGSYHRAIPLVAVLRAEADMRHHVFHFTYDSGMGNANDEFELASEMEANELVSVLRQQLGDRYVVSNLGFDVARVCGGPFVALMVHAVASYFAWMTVSPPTGAPHRGTALERWLLDGPGEQGVRTFAIGVGAVLLLWLVGRFLRRPHGVLFKKTSI